MKTFAITQYWRVRLKARRKLLNMVHACRDITPLMSQSFDRRLSRGERLSLKLHLVVCLWCSRYLEQITLLKDLLQQEEPSAMLEGKLSSEARQRLSDRLRNRPH